MVKRIIFVLMLMVIALIPVHAQDDEEDLETVVFFLTFVPNVQFSPVYLMEGHLAEAGYALELQYSEENVGVDLIASGNLHYGMISGEQVVMARAGDRPVVYVYEWFHEYPIAIIVPDTTEAESITDLAGLRVGVPGRFGATYSGLLAALAANDLSEGDIRLESIGFAAPDVVCAGGVDASTVYINNEPLQIQRRADAGDCGDITGLTVFPVSDYVDIVSNGVVTNEDRIAENPEEVQAVVDAFRESVREAVSNPAQAYLATLEHDETLPINDEFRAALEEAAAEFDALADDMDTTWEDIATARADFLAEMQVTFEPDLLIQLEVLLATIELWTTEDNEFGFTDPASWEETLSIVEAMGNLVSPVDDLEAAYTNDFIGQ
jgi:NitT/TauT family transport system substrate-binding protein